MQHNHDDGEYREFLARVQTRFLQRIQDGARPVFLTDAENLWAQYLDSFTDPVRRQYKNCSACRKFIERFGSLAIVEEDGSIHSAIWHEEDALDEYTQAVAALGKAVRRAKITSPFLSREAVWGSSEAGGWLHFAVTPPAAMRYSGAILTPVQAMAEKREDFKTVMHALTEFTQPMLETAVALLKSDHLYSSERVLGQAEWLHKLHVAYAAASGHGKAAVVWAATAKAPAGFCHPRSSMIGTLLEDIAAGLEFNDIAKRFADKMHPLRYQRPQALPSAGNIAQAEKLFAQLGLAPALERRIARLDEIPLVWAPKAEEQPSRASSGLFSHLTPKKVAQAPTVDIPAITMTLEKFLREVATTADTMEIDLGGGNHGFIALTTAVNLDAPTLFQWDHPFSWYVWHGGAPVSQYGLAPGWLKVAGMTRLPARWNDDGQRFKHHGDGIIMLLAGARETRQAGAALFPSLLRSELHGVRSTIEAHSRSAQMHNLAEGSAIGYDLREGSGSYPATVRVSTAGRVQTYKIDRWD
ncbi:hypothetical protein [Eleftheria terrae]|uniref:hypothetical protein n=1 Tax=Eleftheria terrae TaxID=1597781 RepID=UPI00263BB69F|nr:hypothetical protein [Eleftheria terrae]WKB55789.1 hypothetical protein N7L95_27275 [Eleftheria terrae]